MKENTDDLVLQFVTPRAPLEFTGERFTHAADGQIKWEHLHRYFSCLDFCKEKDVLDIASGEGYGTNLIGQVARSVVGVDIDAKSIEHAQKNYSSDHISFKLGSAANIPLAVHSVDVAVSFETIEHFDFHDHFLSEIKRVLRPNGILIISTPNVEIYSPSGHTDNPFHTKELSKEDFVSLISKYFVNWKLFSQNVLAGSCIAPSDDNSLTSLTIKKFFNTKDGTQYQKQSTLNEPSYFLVIASDGEFISLATSILNDSQYLARLGGIIAESNDKFVNLKNDCVIIKNKLDTTKAELDTTKAELDTTKAELEITRNTINTVYSTLSWKITKPLRWMSKKFPHIVFASRRSLKIIAKEIVLLNKYYLYLKKSLKATTKLLNSLLTKPLQWDKQRLIFEQRSKKCPVAVCLHLFYIDLWLEIKEFLKNIPVDFDLIVSVCGCWNYYKIVSKIKSAYPNAAVFVHENCGRDIGPFITLLNSGVFDQFDVVCKIHSKKSLYGDYGTLWRQDLLTKLLGTPNIVSDILNTFKKRKDLGMVGPSGHFLGDAFLGGNQQRVEQLGEKMGISKKNIKLGFFAGSMFWFAPIALQPLRQLNISLMQFEDDKRAQDATMSHALERIFCFSTNANGLKVTTTAALIAEAEKDKSVFSIYQENNQTNLFHGNTKTTFKFSFAGWRKNLFFSEVNEKISSKLLKIYYWLYLFTTHAHELFSNFCQTAHKNCDIIYFSSAHQNLEPQWQCLFSKLIENGHRIFYIKLDPEKTNNQFYSKKISKNLYEITISFFCNEPKNGGIEKFLELINNIFVKFKIKESVSVVQSFWWNLLARHLKNKLDTKIILEYLEEKASSKLQNISTIFVKSELPKISDYFATSSVKMHDENKDIYKNIKLIKNPVENKDWENWSCNMVNEIENFIKEVYPLVSIIVVTFNNLEYTRLCVNSIYNNTTYPNFELIVIDNASNNKTKIYLEKLRSEKNNVKIFFNAENKGFAAANNIGIKESSGNYIILLNNDTIVTKGWISGLIKYLDISEVGEVGPVTNSIGNEAKINVSYKTLFGINNFAESYTAKHKNKHFNIQALAMYCVALKKETIEKVGLLDENFTIGMFEDDDYSMRIKQKGLRVVCVEDVFIHHFGSVSFNKLMPNTLMEIFSENRKKYEKKWGNWIPHEHRK